jgi:hypothetical protein
VETRPMSVGRMTLFCGRTYLSQRPRVIGL